MKGKNHNISLANCGEFKQSGLLITLRKAINEAKVFSRVRGKRIILPRETCECKLSFIICTTGEYSGLFNAVDSALNQSIAKSLYEVIVVINGDAYIELPKGVRVVREEKLGISRARNTGAKNAKGEFLLYIDDDAVADFCLAEKVINAFEEHRNSAIVGGQIKTVFPEGKKEIVLKGKEGLWSAYTVPYKRSRVIKEQYEFPYGACFGIRKDALNILGGFPEEYGRVGNNYEGGEETVLCFLAQRNGWKIVIEPGAEVKHYVADHRVSYEHIERTIREGIFTTYRLICDGYAPYRWDKRYIAERLDIAEKELENLKERGLELECFYKKSERDAFLLLLEELKKNEVEKEEA